MPNPNFLNHDLSLSDDGRKLETWLQVNLNAMESASADELNSYPGTLKYLFSNRHVMSPARFIQDFPKTYAQSAWAIMEAIELSEQQTQQVQETAAKTDDLAAALEKLREDFAGQIAALKMENGKLRKQMKALKEDESAETKEPAADDDETPATEETEDESAE